MTSPLVVVRAGALPFPAGRWTSATLGAQQVLQRGERGCGVHCGVDGVAGLRVGAGSGGVVQVAEEGEVSGVWAAWSRSRAISRLPAPFARRRRAGTVLNGESGAAAFRVAPGQELPHGLDHTGNTFRVTGSRSLPLL